MGSSFVSSRWTTKGWCNLNAEAEGDIECAIPEPLLKLSVIRDACQNQRVT
jgi:hypothetical protein